MSLTPQQITLDLNPSFTQMQTVHCSQYDDNIRQIIVKLQDGGTNIDVSSYTIYIEGTKPDKHGFSYPLTEIGSVSGNTVTFYIQLQMCAVPGMTRAEVVLKSGDNRIGSANFMLAVERAGLQDDTNTSDSELAPYIDGAESAAREAAQSASDSEAWAVGKRNGADVDSSDVTYHNNSKYYADQVSGSLPAIQAAIDAVNDRVDGISLDYYEETNPITHQRTEIGISLTKDGQYTDVAIWGTDTPIPEATTSKNGWMSAQDKTDLTNVKASVTTLEGEMDTAQEDLSDLLSAKSQITEKLELVVSENKIDPSALSVNKFLNGVSGELSDNNSYNTTDLIPIAPGDVIRLFKNDSDLNTIQIRTIEYFKSDKTHLSGDNTGAATQTAPENAAYFRCCYLSASGTVMCLLNTATPISFIPYTAPYYVATDAFVGTLDIDESTDFDSKYLDFSMVCRLDPATCQTGKFLNGTTGAVSDNAGYFITGYMPIRKNETLYFLPRYTNNAITARTIAAYDKSKTLLGMLGTNTPTGSYTQSGEVAFIRACFGYNTSYTETTPYGVTVLSVSNPQYAPGYGGQPEIKNDYLRKTIYVRITDAEAQIIEKFVNAYAIGECDVIFERGNYSFGTDLPNVKTTYNLFANEIPVGNGCRYFFNGSTLSASIDLSTLGTDFACNFFGTQNNPSSFEMHDGALIATDTVYVMHDESSALNGTYKHLYQNMEMAYNTSLRTADIRKCIGGGTGASGVVEIVGCKFTTDAPDVSVSFHGNASDVAGAAFDLTIRNCWFSNAFRAGELSASQSARLFATGNSTGLTPTTSYARWSVTSFLNEVRP